MKAEDRQNKLKHSVSEEEWHFLLNIDFIELSIFFLSKLCCTFCPQYTAQCTFPTNSKKILPEPEISTWIMLYECLSVLKSVVYIPETITKLQKFMATFIPADWQSFELPSLVANDIQPCYPISLTLLHLWTRVKIFPWNNSMLKITFEKRAGSSHCTDNFHDLKMLGAQMAEKLSIHVIQWLENLPTLIKSMPAVYSWSHDV